MNHSPSSHAVTFDLEHGQVRLAGDDSGRAVLVPVAALIALVEAAGVEASRELGRAIGRQLGARLAARSPLRALSLEAAMTEIASELAAVGLGALFLERWGRALVVVVDGAPRGEAGTSPAIVDALIGATLEALLSFVTTRTVACLPIARDGERLRILVASPARAEQATRWLQDGVSWGELISRLHTPHAEGT